MAVKLFVFDILSVEGGSMEPSLHDGENIFVSKLSYGLVNPFGSSTFIHWRDAKKGDIVVYLYNSNYVVKRCVAVEGETIAISDETPYTLTVGGATYPLTPMQRALMEGSGRVPEGTILAVGDNYDASIDSRTYGFVPQEDLLGKVLFK